MNWCQQRGQPVVADFAVSVEEDDDLAGGRDGAVVAGPRQEQ
jgi:hypothetical protein